jgi:hypothetical protein
MNEIKNMIKSKHGKPWPCKAGKDNIVRGVVESVGAVGGSIDKVFTVWI